MERSNEGLLPRHQTPSSCDDLLEAVFKEPNGYFGDIPCVVHATVSSAFETLSDFFQHTHQVGPGCLDTSLKRNADINPLVETIRLRDGQQKENCPNVPVNYKSNVFIQVVHIPGQPRLEIIHHVLKQGRFINRFLQNA
ncbi:hypothetical protein M513_01020 [Trichuris suis]|uniref:Uncharacterized protein n=1 Tax=Trichuris suis TaxID=68888 RepID=A0A085MM11_9BILA|nr:hypothetical protein M513_01020 [Trichuris suis]